MEDGVDQDATQDGAPQAPAAATAEHPAAAVALVGVAAEVVHIRLRQLGGLRRQRVGLLGVGEGRDRIGARDGQGVIEVPLRLGKPGACLSAHTAAASGDVVRRCADLRLGGHDGLLERGLGPARLLLLVPDAAECLVQRLVGSFHPLQCGDRVNLAALDFRLDLREGAFDAGHRSGQFRVCPGLDHGPCLGEVLRGVHNGTLEAAPGLVEVG